MALCFICFNLQKKKMPQIKSNQHHSFQKFFYLCRQHERCEKHCLTRNFAVFQIYNKTKAT